MWKSFVGMAVSCLLLALSPEARPCTVAVVSGSAAPDGRPLMWKNRDAGQPANRMVLLRGKKYVFLALANSPDTESKEVWAGANDAGFAIMNSASYNLDADRAPEEAGDEGALMRRALGECAGVDEFEALLREAAGSLVLRSNFGVIDARGGAALFETGLDGYVRFDAADRRVAPEGHLVRTNYSYTGEPNTGAGYIRYDRIARLFHEQAAAGGITRDWILTLASRDMVNAFTGVDPLRDPPPAHAADRRMYYMHDSLTRASAVSAVLFHGVRPGEDPAGTAVWARLGHPLAAPALPLWVGSAAQARLSTGEPTAPINRFARIVHERLFPFPRGGRDRYMDLAPAHNQADTGTLRHLPVIEREVLASTDRHLGERIADPSRQREAQREAEAIVERRLREAYPEEAAGAGLGAGAGTGR